MAKSILKTEALRKISGAHKELFNENGLQIYALKSGRFEIVCGTTHSYAKSLQEVADKIDHLELHQFPSSGQEVLAGIKKNLGKQYRFEIHGSKMNSKDEVVHSVEGSREHIESTIEGISNLDIQNLSCGRRYAMQNNIYDGDYAVLTPLADVEMYELSPSFEEPQLYEKQVFSKGMVLYGVDPKNQAVLAVLVDEAYPNGSFKDSDGQVYSSGDIELYQFTIGEPSSVEEDFKEPDMSLYESEDIPTYNPTDEVMGKAPMIGDLSNYDSILSASAGILSDFMKTAKKVAFIDQSSLNKISVAAINSEGQVTDGEIEWNVRVGSPKYRRSSQIMIPMAMVKGELDIGKEFITSTGQKLPLTVEGISEHLGSLTNDDSFRFAAKEVSECHPSTLKRNADVENLLDGIDFGTDVEAEKETESSVEKISEASPNVVIFDDGGKTADRYTIIDMETGDMQGASEDPFHPQGFGQYVGNVTDPGYQEKFDSIEDYVYRAREDSSFLGKEVSFEEVPEPVQQFITQRVSETEAGGQAETEAAVEKGPDLDRELVKEQENVSKTAADDKVLEIADALAEGDMSVCSRITPEMRPYINDYLRDIGYEPEEIQNIFGTSEASVSKTAEEFAGGFEGCVDHFVGNSDFKPRHAGDTKKEAAQKLCAYIKEQKVSSLSELQAAINVCCAENGIEYPMFAPIPKYLASLVEKKAEQYHQPTAKELETSGKDIADQLLRQ